MGVVIGQRAGADCGGGVVDGASHDRCVWRQAERGGRVREQRADDFGAGDQLGEFVGVDAAVAQTGRGW